MSLDHGTLGTQAYNLVEMGYSQSKLICDHCVNELVRPTRIPPRQ